MPDKHTFQDHTQAIQEATKLAPPIAIGGTGLVGVDWQSWVLIVTLVYTILLVIHKAIQIYRDIMKLGGTDKDSTFGGLK